MCLRINYYSEFMRHWQTRSQAMLREHQKPAQYLCPSTRQLPLPLFPVVELAVLAITGSRGRSVMHARNIKLTDCATYLLEQIPGCRNFFLSGNFRELKV